LEHTEIFEAKDRIISASIHLFSRKGFDATSVNEIADEADVTKALIYYYFKNKEDILDHLVHSLLDNATSITMDFIHANIVQMIKDGRLDIESDRLHFVNDEAIQHFLQKTHIYYKDLLDYTIENRDVFRILMLESIKHSKHRNKLFLLMNLTKEREGNPIFKTIFEVDNDFNYSDDMILFKFFFSIIPLVSFAAYYDDYKELSGLSDEELRSSFASSFQIVFDSMISGRDILLKNKNI
jgi:AcrR family transcriptional regulator